MINDKDPKTLTKTDLCLRVFVVEVLTRQRGPAAITEPRGDISLRRSAGWTVSTYLQIRATRRTEIRTCNIRRTAGAASSG